MMHVGLRSKENRWMKALAAVALAAGCGVMVCNAQQQGTQQPSTTSGQWQVHDMKRPRPAVVTPGTFSTDEKPGTPPSDAIVLFDGKDLSKWKGDKGDAAWKVEDGYFEVVAKAGAIRTRDSFGDCQLHVEWRAPSPAKGNSQARGNSGIFLMDRYEIQVLDTYENVTYADGGAGSVYGQFPPLVNATRKPGEWQTYDIIFRRPRYENGKVVKPAVITVMLNGVVVQDSTEAIGPTTHKKLASYPANHPDKAPIQLQDHGDPVRFRNIWIRPLPEEKPVAAAVPAPQ